MATSPAAAVTTPATTPAANGLATTPAQASETEVFAAVLNPVQLASFERANVKLLNLTHATDAPLGPRVTQAVAACGRLDPQQPMLVAFALQCEPTVALAKLSVVSSKRCDGSLGPGPCKRLLRRMSRALAALSDADEAFRVRVREAIDNRKCLSEIAPTRRTIQAMAKASRLAELGAEAIERRDDPGFQAALRRLQDALGDSDEDPGQPGPILRRLRAACGLARTPSPPGERIDGT